MKIACVQMDVEPAAVARNRARMEDFVAEAAGGGADLVVFPELCDTDYYVGDFAALEIPLLREHSDGLSCAAREHGVVVIAGLLESTAQGRHNSAILIDPQGDIQATYRKTHLSCDTRGGTIRAEADDFLPGDSLPVFDTTIGRIGMMICKDGDYPEVSRTLTVQDARIIFWLTNRANVSKAAFHLAESNRVALVVSNRANGHAPGCGSIILNCTGEALAQAGEEEAIIYGELDPEEMQREHEYHWTVGRVRRPELYGPLAESSTDAPAGS
jgi:predicted amidohydrolase